MADPVTWTALVPVAIEVIKFLPTLFGRPRTPPPAIDVKQVNAANEEAIRRSEQAWEEKLAAMQSAHEKETQALADRTSEEARQKESAFQELQRQMQKRHEREQLAVARAVAEIEEEKAEAQEQLARLQAQLAGPVRDRAAKVTRINALRLAVRSSHADLAVMGTRGMHKSTFLWLAGKVHEQPTRTLTHGTTAFVQSNGALDTIGLAGWTSEQILKVIVILLYEGFPGDLVVCSRDRVFQPTSSLHMVGIHHPLVVTMGGFWAAFNGGKFVVRSGPTSRVMLPVAGAPPEGTQVSAAVAEAAAKDMELLDQVYDLESNAVVTQLGLGTPVMHMQLNSAVAQRRAAGVRPFQALKDMLGPTFSVLDNEPNQLKELLFRLVYLFEVKYNKDVLRFINQAKVEEFNDA